MVGTRGAVGLDLLVCVSVALASVASAVLSMPTALLALFGVPALLFVPGYVALAALLGARERVIDDRPNQPTWPRIVALSAAGSTVVVGAITYTVIVSPWPLESRTVLGGLATFVVATSLIAGIRRLNHPVDGRSGADGEDGLQRFRAALFRPDTRVEGVLNLVLVGSVLVAGVGIGMIAVDPGHQQFTALESGNQQTFTEFSLLVENSNGSYVFDGYPETAAGAAESDLAVAISNHEGQRQTYTVVVVGQSLRETGDSMTVADEAELDRTEVTVPSGQTRYVEFETDVSSAGSDDASRYRLKYFLYRGDATESPAEATAYRSLELQLQLDETA